MLQTETVSPQLHTRTRWRMAMAYITNPPIVQRLDHHLLLEFNLRLILDFEEQLLEAMAHIAGQRSAVQACAAIHHRAPGPP